MSVPDYEMKALYDWSTSELNRIDVAYPDVIGMLDGQGDRERKRHFQEYNHRLVILKQKYEAQPISKPHAFNELLQHA